MLLSELVRSQSDYELESALRAAISARRVGSISAISYSQLAKMANLDSLSKAAFDAFIEKHPDLGKFIEQSSDNGIALADPSSLEEPADTDLTPEPEAGKEPEAGADDLSLAPDAMDDMGAGIDLSAGTNTGAPLTPDNRVQPTQDNGAAPKPKEYDQVQTAAQRALGRRS